MPTIKEILNELRDQKWVLPNFQRDFVWSADQVAFLFDSMMRGYPIGAIILLKYKKAFPFQPRGLDDDEELRRKQEFYIIDGQQRLTSIYKIINKYSNTSDVEEELQCLTFKKDQGSEQRFAFFLKYNADETTDRYVYSKKINKKSISDEWIKEREYIPLEYVFCEGHILNSYLKKHKIKTFKNNIIKFKNNIHKYELTVKNVGIIGSWMIIEMYLND